MIEIRDIKPRHLLLDSKNPRLSRIEDQQLEALHRLWTTERAKVLGLASHLSSKGLDPTVRMAVIRAPDGGSQDYVVLEGNRRLAAMMALSDPGSVSDVLTPAEKIKLGAYSVSYLESPVQTVPCAVFGSREEAEPWIELRHSADPTGAGVVMWGAEEKSRFKSRGKTHELAVQIVDVVKAEGKLAPSQKADVQKGRFLTTLRRFTNDPEVRSRLNLSSDANDGTIRFGASRTKTVKALTKIVDDFASGTKTVKDVFYKTDRRDYLAALDAAGLLPPARPAARPVSAPPPPPGPAEGKRGAIAGARRERDKLFHSSINLNLRGEPRIANIVTELRRLDVEQYKNAVAVLFRVFLELSVDQYLKKKQLMKAAEVDELWSLYKKIKAVLKYMASKAILDAQELKPLRRALQDSDGIVGPANLRSIQAYLHNPHFNPRPKELKLAADDWQRLLEKIWS